MFNTSFFTIQNLLIIAVVSIIAVMISEKLEKKEAV